MIYYRQYRHIDYPNIFFLFILNYTLFTLYYYVFLITIYIAVHPHTWHQGQVCCGIVTRDTKWNVSEILWISLKHPSGKEPAESIKQGTAEHQSVYWTNLPPVMFKQTSGRHLKCYTAASLTKLSPRREGSKVKNMLSAKRSLKCSYFWICVS